MNIGEKIRILRKQQKLTLKMLGAKIELSPTFLCDIEQGRTQPSLARLSLIADALGTTIAFLVGEDNNSRPLPLNHLATLHNLYDSEDGRQLLQSLTDFTHWENADRQELLHYLKVKIAVRNIGNAENR